MKKLFAILAAAFVLPASQVFSHGNGPHADNASVSRSAEQKPFGIAGDPQMVSRDVMITMTDQMRFVPSHIDVREGETVRLKIQNNGKLLHEMVLGTMKELKDHAELMRVHPGMEHDEPYIAHVQPGKTGEIIWHFNRPGKFDFACLVAGHFEAGMTGTIAVKPAR